MEYEILDEPQGEQTGLIARRDGGLVEDRFMFQRERMLHPDFSFLGPKIAPPSGQMGEG